MQQAKVESKVNNYLQILAHPKFHKQGASPDARLRLAKKILNALLSAETVQDDPSKSYTDTNVNDNAKNVPKQAPSTLDEKMAACVAKARQDYPGITEDGLQRICSTVVTPSISATGPMISSQKIAHGTGGGYTTSTTTKMPDSSKLMKKSDAHPKPHIQSASSEIPAWVYAIHPDGIPNQPPTTETPTNLKSAATNYLKSKYLYDTSIADILESHATSRQAVSEAKNQRLMSASQKKKSEIPAWARATCDWL